MYSAGVARGCPRMDPVNGITDVADADVVDRVGHGGAEITEVFLSWSRAQGDRGRRGKTVAWRMYLVGDATIHADWR